MVLYGTRTNEDCKNTVKIKSVVLKHLKNTIK